MTKIGFGISVLMLHGILMQGCSSARTNQSVDEKVDRESDITSKQALLIETSRVIQNAPGLNPKQRDQLTDIKTAMRANLNDLNEESLKLRAVLVKDLVTKVDNSDEISVIKDRMKSLEEQKLKIVFNAIDKANGVLGKNAADHQQVMRDFFNDTPGVSQE